VDDAGLANERTALAWQRTALSLVAASAVLARLTWSTLGAVAVVPLLAALTLSVGVLVDGWGRYTHAAGAGRRRSRGSHAPLALTGAAVLLAIVELAAIGSR
jgi:uncharacterized membrane protein YidH (DUF202 family)